MKLYIRAIIVLSCLIPASAVFSQESGTAVDAYRFNRFDSAASPDIMFAADTNPAALGFSANTGLFSELAYPLNEYNRGISFNPLLYQRNLYISLSLPGLGISYESYEYSNDEKDAYLTFGSGARIARWLSLGYGARYRTGNFSSAEFSAGFLLRPHTSLSLATTYRADLQDAWSLQPALAIRPLALLPLALLPLAGDLGDLLTLSVDGLFDAQGAVGTMYGFQHAGINLELLPGMFIYGSYHEDQSWSAGVDFSLGFGRSGFRTISVQNEYTLVSRSSLEFPAYKTFPAPAASRIIEYSGTLSFSETEALQSFGSFSMPDGRRPYRSFVEEINSFRDDPSVSALLFNKVQFQADLAIATEISSALSELIAAGTSVIFSLEGADRIGYYIAAASGADIYMRPGSMLLVQGFGGSQLFFGDLLHRFGIDVVGFETHPAKSANHMFTDTGFSDESRANIEAFISDVYLHYLDEIARGRGERLTENISDIWDYSPFFHMSDALNFGLIDGILYEDQVYDLLDDLYPGAAATRHQKVQIRDSSWYRPRKPRIAVINAVGLIFTGRGLHGTSIGSDTLAEQIRWAREDDSTEAILLRVSSGGGSALASDIIAREVYLTVHGPDSKPLVVSMGDVAASGGYYIAAYADYIFAYPMSLTGSIGVTSLSFHIDRLLDEWDIHPDRVDTSPSSAFLDPFYPLREEDATAYSSGMEAIYEQFLTVVTEGRGMDRDEVDQHARGQVWTGSQALERGLIDELGGFSDALEKTRELAGIAGDFEIYTPSVGNWQELSGFAAGLAVGVSERTRPSLPIPELEDLHADYLLLRELSESGILYWTPYSGLFD